MKPFGLAQRVGSTAQNAAELIRYGGLQVDEVSSPYEVTATKAMYALRRYFPDDVPSGLPALVLVPPLMMMADLFDVAPRSSSVQAVHDAGIDVWVVDFGRPESTPGGLSRSIGDHVLALSDAVDEVCKATGRDVVLGGYSQGGMFCYQAAAYRRGEGIDSIIAFGSPVDFTAAPLPIPISTQSYTQVAKALVNTGLLPHLSLPGWLNRTATQLLDPVKTVQFRLQYLRQLHDREKLAPGEQQRKFLAQHGWTAYSGPAFADLLQLIMTQNRMVAGGFVFGDRTVALADIDLPILTVVGDIDREGHPLAVRAIRQAAPRAEVYELTLHTGHFGIVAGNGARRRTWPRVAEWVRWRAGQGELPDVIVPADQAGPAPTDTPSMLAQRFQDATDLGVGITRIAYNTVAATADFAATVARYGARQVPLLNRLEALRPDTAISLGLLLDEAAQRDPDGVALLFGDRVLRHREVKHRVDSIVRGLLHLGVRQGDRVGVLMGARPSAFTVLAAISRLGAAAVLLRPDGDRATEARLGEIAFLVSDPEHAADTPLPGVTWAVLGGGTTPRDLPAHIVDLERVEPETVPVPAWYRANPRRAVDVAFVLFTGDGDGTRARVVTSRRWALSALGTASAAALDPGHTVYSTTPLHHPSALLMAVGGAVVSGARLALAGDTDPETFWAEVRRYGATHVSYTWTSLRAVATGPRHPNERDHPIRLFLGSGMPTNLWRRVNERFAPARVLEFYASADGEAILANVAGTKIGAVGRPLPGSAAVRIARYHTGSGRLVYGSDGFAQECGTDERGLLLAVADPQVGRPVLRGVFAPDDAWQPSGDLFTKDADGDLWLVDPADGLIRTAHGLAAPSRIRNALGRIPAVDLAVVYGVPHDGDEQIVAAVTLFPGAELGAWDLESALRTLDPALRPAYVQVVDDIPVTTWSRPQWRPLRAAGLPDPAVATVWRLGANRETYERKAR